MATYKYTFTPRVVRVANSIVETSSTVSYTNIVYLDIKLNRNLPSGYSADVYSTDPNSAIGIKTSIRGDNTPTETIKTANTIILPKTTQSTSIEVGRFARTVHKSSNSSLQIQCNSSITNKTILVMGSKPSSSFPGMEDMWTDVEGIIGSAFSDTFTVGRNATYTYNLSAIRVDTDSSTTKSDNGRYAFITANISTGFTGADNKIQSCKLQKVGAQSPTSTTWYSSSNKTSAVSFPRTVSSSPETWYTWIPIDEQAWSFDFSLTNKFEEQETVRLVVPAIFKTIHVAGEGHNLAFGGSAKNEGLTNYMPEFAMPLIGTIQMYAGATAPNGWFLCNGQAISRTTYADLFAVIGTTYGSGNGSTTFNLPNLGGRIPIGRGENAANTTDYWGSYSAGTNNFSNLGERGGHVAATIPQHSHPIAQRNVGDGGAHSGTADFRFWGSDGRLITGRSGVLSVGDITGSAYTAQSTTKDPKKLQRLTLSVGNHQHTLGAHNTNNTGEADAHKAAPMQPYIVLNYIIHVGVPTI